MKLIDVSHRESNVSGMSGSFYSIKYFVVPIIQISSRFSNNLEIHAHSDMCMYKNGVQLVPWEYKIFSTKDQITCRKLSTIFIYE